MMPGRGSGSESHGFKRLLSKPDVITYNIYHIIKIVIIIIHIVDVEYDTHYTLL